MNIIHIITSLEIGGAQKLVHDLALSQKTLGNNVTVLVYYRCGSILEKELETSGIKILSLDSKNIKSIKILIKIHRIIKAYDIAHIHLFPPLYQLVLASIGTKIPLVYTEHSTYNRRRKKNIIRPVEQFIYRRYSKIISISEQTQNALLDWLMVKDFSKFQVIHNGVDLRKYNEAKKNTVEDLFGRSGIPILMVSRFVPAKDQLTLIKAIRYINFPNAFVAFAGDGELIDRAKYLAKNLGVSDRCVFLGTRNDIPELIKTSAIGVQSSHWEGFGLTAVEFMAAGKPILASSVDGLKQVVEGAGEIFQAGDEKGLAEKINILLADHSYYDSMAEKCRIRATKYDISVMTQQYQKIYQNLCKK